jgi:hypothetical protein
VALFECIFECLCLFTFSKDYMNVCACVWPCRRELLRTQLFLLPAPCPLYVTVSHGCALWRNTFVLTSVATSPCYFCTYVTCWWRHLPVCACACMDELYKCILQSYCVDVALLSSAASFGVALCVCVAIFIPRDLCSVSFNTTRCLYNCAFILCMMFVLDMRGLMVALCLFGWVC